jgi:hypothetical protein
MALRISNSSLSAISSIFVSYSKSLSTVSIIKNLLTCNDRADMPAVAEAMARQAGHAPTVKSDAPGPYPPSSAAGLEHG